MNHLFQYKIAFKKFHSIIYHSCALRQNKTMIKIVACLILVTRCYSAKQTIFCCK